MKKKLSFLMIIVTSLLLATFCGVLAENTSVLHLPSSLITVGEQAFYQATSLDTVVVPDGTTTIESKAFAYSSLHEITLPGSLTSIANDAFEGCRHLKVNVPMNCYAYHWCLDHGYIPAQVSLSVNASPSVMIQENTISTYDYIANGELQLSWSATNGNGLYSYKVLLVDETPDFTAGTENIIKTIANEADAAATSVRISLADMRLAKYIKVWIQAQELNYELNGASREIQFAIWLKPAKNVTVPVITTNQDFTVEAGAITPHYANVNGDVTISWSAANGNGKYSYEIVMVNDEPDFSVPAANVVKTLAQATGDTATSYTIATADMKLAKYVRIWIQAQDSHYDQNEDGSDIQFALEVVRLRTPTITKAVAGATTVDLSWPELPVSGATYTVWYGESGSTPTAYTTVDGTSCKVTGLTGGTTYQFGISARIGYTSLGASAMVTVTTLEGDGVVNHRALLIGEESFDPICTRNWGDVGLMTSMLGAVNGSGGSGFSVTQLKDQSPAQILSAIASTFSGADEDDVSLFFIATHGDNGSTDEYAGALFTVDASGNESYMTMRTLADALSNVPGKVIVMLESCGAGAAIYEEGVAENSKLVANTQSNGSKFTGTAISAFSVRDKGVTREAVYYFDDPGEEYDEKSPPLLANTGEFRQSKFYVLAAARYLEMSYGWESTVSTPFGNIPCNVFTRSLARGVGASGAMPADTNHDGQATLNELFNYIKADSDDKQHVQRYPVNSSYVLFQR